MAAGTGGADGMSRRDKLEAISGLLERALQLLDEIGDCPAIGAKIQGIIEVVENARTA